MSESEQTALEDSIGLAIGHNVRPFMFWLQGVLVAVVVGTATVVGFIHQTNSAIDKCSTIIARHEQELHDLQVENKARDKAISRVEGRLGLVSAKTLSEPKELEEN